MFNYFGFNFFVTIALIITSIANNAYTAPAGELGAPANNVKTKTNVWPHDIHLDVSNWRNACKMTYVNDQGPPHMPLNDALKKISLTVDTFLIDFNNSRSNELNLKNDHSHLDHQYRAIPKFNKTLPVRKLLRDIHKSVQIYVGMFDALTKRYSVIDIEKQNSTNEISTELTYYLNESKLLLCEIETSLNVSCGGGTTGKQSCPKAQYLTRNEMQHKILRSTIHLNKTTSILNKLDALYSKRYFYEFVVDLGKYLHTHENRRGNGGGGGGAKKSLNQNKRRANKKNRNLSKKLNNNSSSDLSASASGPQKRPRKPTGSGEKNPKRINNKNKLNNNKKNKSQEGGRKRHRPTKNASASINY